ncbi:MAG: DUF979 domain-containing protein [Alphaproteobacteria bacterium]|nr:DUF979 domain-containing protein [Alphaproteobacteria bacterium]
MIGLDAIYLLAGAMFGAFAIGHARDFGNPYRWRSAAFWGIFSVLLIAGSWLPALASGILVLVMVAIAAIGLKPGTVPAPDGAARSASAARLKDKLFVAALAIPIVTVAGTLLLPKLHWHSAAMVDAAHVTLIALAFGAATGLVLATVLVRAPAHTAAAEGRRLVDAIGWAAVLPQMLAALGGIFAAAGVGAVVAQLASETIPMTLPAVAVIVYTVGMALFTIIMGNAFAAFPVMTAGIGLPLIVGKFGGDPVIMSALGMLSGFCGTLLTPMAANFNIVPAAILELRDRNAVIKVQAPTAFLLLFCNTVMMALFVFHR